MKFITTVIRHVDWRWAQFWHWIRREKRWNKVYWIRRVDDEPDKFTPGILYVIEDVGQAWAAAISCPGGCGQVLHMNLIADTLPVWKLAEPSPGKPTLNPSIWRREGCGCHFFIREGRIVWA